MQYCLLAILFPSAVDRAQMAHSAALAGMLVEAGAFDLSVEGRLVEVENPPWLKC